MNGADIYKEICIMPWQAALGSKIKIQAIDGEILLVLPKGTQSGQVFTIKEKGYKFGRGQRGNFHIITKIVVPKTLSKEEEEVYVKLKELNNMSKKVVKNNV